MRPIPPVYRATRTRATRTRGPLTRTLAAWPTRRWVVAALTGAGYTLLVGVPTDLIDTPLFTREIPPTWWAWPALLASAALVGALVATYVNVATDRPQPRPRAGYAGGLLTFFAVGCPVCNKLVLLALGTAGALTWFEPVQPLIQLAAIGLLGWALWRRLRYERACPTPAPGGTTSV